MFIAEREGFEPPVPLSTTVFKTVVIDHSTISPVVGKTSFVFKSECKGSQIFSYGQIFLRYFCICAVFHLVKRRGLSAFGCRHVLGCSAAVFVTY